MTLPAVTATRNQRINGTTTPDASPTVTPSAGNWVLVVMHLTSSTASVTPPAGWTTLVPITIHGTREFGVWGKVYSPGDSFVFTSNISTNFSVGTVVGTGADAASNWVVGTTTIRGSSIATTTANSITTTVADTLAIQVSTDATSAVETANPTKTGGWTDVLAYWNTVAATNIEAYDISSKAMAVAGATGTSTATWQNASANGAGVQIGITPTAGAITQPWTAVRVGTSLATKMYVGTTQVWP